MRLASTRVLVLAAVVACTGSDAPASHDTAASSPRLQHENTATANPVADDYTISSSGIGPIRLGMTLAQARDALPAATFHRTSDGDGAALVEVILAPDTTMALWADEADADAPVDWTKRITSIETFSTAFHTPAGMHAGSLVTDVERLYGKTKAITLSEIESREYIEFEKQTIRLDYSGIFHGDSRTTKEFQPQAKIWSIAVSSPPAEVRSSAAQDTLWLLAAEPRNDAVHASDSEALLRERYGSANVIRDRIDVGEGETEPATVLFPCDPARRLTVLWADTVARRRPTRVTIEGSPSRWMVIPGVSVGVHLSELERLNGRPFRLYGMQFDYSGTVNSWEGGRLDSLWRAPVNGGHLVWLRLRPAPGADRKLQTEVAGERLFSSAHPAMRALDPAVYDLFIEPR
jgi:hypothetical protein